MSEKRAVAYIGLAGLIRLAVQAEAQMRTIKDTAEQIIEHNRQIRVAFPLPPRKPEATPPRLVVVK